MIRFLKYIIIGMLIFFTNTASVTAQEWTGNVNFQLGARTMADKTDWEPLEDQTMFGINVDFGKESWIVRPVIGFSGSKKEDTILGGIAVTGRTSEFSIGVLKDWEVGPMHPFLSAGLSSIRAEVEAASGGIAVSDSDNSSGLFLDAGIYWRLGKSFNLGFDLRSLGGTDVTLFGVKGNADYGQFALLLGWGW
ncbi:MAG: hypothetical protein ACE5EN_00710 [Nitrospinota bacterium]